MTSPVVKTFVTINEAIALQPRYVDCRFMLTEPSWGRTEYETEHLPGAVFADLNTDLSAPVTEKTGRHPLPSVLKFVSWLSENGFDENQIIVAYDNFRGGLAARFWWMLTQLGFQHVYILIEGMDQWKQYGQPTETEIKVWPATPYHNEMSTWSDGPYETKSLHEIRQTIPSNLLIDSRAPERYRGEEEPYDNIAGHIPGAISLPWESHLDGHKLIADSENISRIVDTTRTKEYVVYCGSGVTACFNLAVFEHLDLEKPKLYPGSYSEWSRNYPEDIETATQ